MVRLFDNTLRDGGNVVGHGFPISLTQSIIGALLEAHGFYGNLSGRENLDLCRRLLGLPTSEIDRVLDVTDMAFQLLAVANLVAMSCRFAICDCSWP